MLFTPEKTAQVAELMVVMGIILQLEVTQHL
jgi:hypothetical protein